VIEIPGQKALEQIAQVASEVDRPERAPYTGADVANILAAYVNVMEGDPVGTILRNPETGAVAVRAVVDGLHIWRVSAPDGDQYNDLQPRLEGWEKIA
jgi:hypothetical protein